MHRDFDLHFYALFTEKLSAGVIYFAFRRVLKFLHIADPGADISQMADGRVKCGHLLLFLRVRAHRRRR